MFIRYKLLDRVWEGQLCSRREALNRRSGNEHVDGRGLRADDGSNNTDELATNEEPSSAYDI